MNDMTKALQNLGRNVRQFIDKISAVFQKWTGERTQHLLGMIKQYDSTLSSNVITPGVEVNRIKWLTAHLELVHYDNIVKRSLPESIALMLRLVSIEMRFAAEINEMSTALAWYSLFDALVFPNPQTQ